MTWDGMEFLNDSQATSLFNHLCIVLNREDAEFTVHDIDMSCVDFTAKISRKTSCLKGTKKPPKKPHRLDELISELWTRIMDHHTGPKNKKFKSDEQYWSVHYRHNGLLKERNLSRQRGAPPREERSDLIRRIWDHYPYEIRDQSKTKNHFGKTVKMVLEFTGETKRTPYRSDLLADALREYD